MHNFVKYYMKRNDSIIMYLKLMHVIFLKKQCWNIVFFFSIEKQNRKEKKSIIRQTCFQYCILFNYLKTTNIEIGRNFNENKLFPEAQWNILSSTLLSHLENKYVYVLSLECIIKRNVWLVSREMNKKML